MFSQILYVPVITAYNTSYVAYLKDGKGGKNARSYLLLKGRVSRVVALLPHRLLLTTSHFVLDTLDSPPPIITTKTMSNQKIKKAGGAVSGSNDARRKLGRGWPSRP